MTGKGLASFLISAAMAFGAIAAERIDGPVKDSVPIPPDEPLPESWRLKTDLSTRMSGGFDIRKRHAGQTPWLKNRISRCFFGPIKRPPFNRDELADDVDYYPDDYLERLAREGVNGLWLTIEFKDFSRELTGDWPEGAQRRLEKLRQVVAKCARHGIRIWLFCIEPIEQDFRKSPLALKHPDWIGCTYDNLMGTMCASHPGVQKYIENTVRDIFSEVPGLGGMINISEGERITSCLSICCIDSHPCRTLCPRCKDVPLAELLHRVNRAFVRGIRAAGSDAEFISWIYRGAHPTLPEWVSEAARTVPDGVIQQNNFETGVIVDQMGRTHIGEDYWLSQPGPAEAFAGVARAARSNRRRMSAKIQVSCSHEIATIPVLPVPGLLYRKFKGMHDLGVTDAMYCWYFGSAPGLMNRAAGELAYSDFKESEDEFLKRLAADDWGEDAEMMGRIWKACSDGFSRYPVSNVLQYYGPYHQGVVWPLRADVEMRPLGASWEPNQPAGGDLIGECLADFDLQEALSLAQQMCAETERIKPDLAALERKYAGQPERLKDLGLVRAFCCHLEAARDIFEFYYLRREALICSRRDDRATALRALARMRKIAEDGKSLAVTMKRLCLADSMLGFHSEAESYIYTPDYLDWRIGTLASTLTRLGEIERAVEAGEGYPLSPLEKAAPVFPARLDGKGDLIIEGDAKGTSDVTVWTWDTCGTTFAKSHRVRPVGGRFKLTIPSLEWNNDPRLRPGWIQIHQGCHWLGDSWQWPKHPAFAWRWHHGDLLGFYSAKLVIEETGTTTGFAWPGQRETAFDLKTGLFRTDYWAGIGRHLAVVNPVGRSADPYVLSLAGEWSFWMAPHGSGWRTVRMQDGADESVWKDSKPIRVPGCWQANGIGDEGLGVPNLCSDNAPKRLRHHFVGEGWYRKTVRVPESWRGRRLWLKVGGVLSRGWFYVNQHPVALVDEHAGAFKYEITDFVVPGSNVTVTVCADNAVSSRTGRGEVERWGGLVRDVELESTPQVFIDDAWVRGDFDGRMAEVKVKVEGERRDGNFLLRATVAGETREVDIHSSPSSSDFTLKIPLRNFHPWSPEQPNLYWATIELVDAGRVVQTWKERFGVRKFEVRGKEFFLNGRPYYIRGCGDNEPFPMTGCSPADREEHIRNFRILKAAGFNCVRLHTHTEVPEYFEAADEVGMMIQPEVPYYNDNPKDDFGYDPIRDVTARWRAFRRYPSYAINSQGNEGLLGPAAGRIVSAYLKELDPDRLVIEQDGGTYLRPRNGEGVGDFCTGPLVPWPRGSFDPPRPFVAHEYLNLSVKFDPRDEKSYTGCWLPPTTVADRVRWLAKSGLSSEWGDRLMDAQHALQAFWQKNGIELARMDPFCDGYCFWSVTDSVVWNDEASAFTGQGLFDAFHRAKRCGNSAADFARFNSASCLLLDNEGGKCCSCGHDADPRRACDAFYRVSREGIRRVYESGETIPLEFLLAHYGEAEIPAAKLMWHLSAEGRILAGENVEIGRQALGGVRSLCRTSVVVPSLRHPVRALLTAVIPGEGGTSISNDWRFWLFPDSPRPDAKAHNVRVVAYGSEEERTALASGRHVVSLANQDGKPNFELGWWWIGKQTGTALQDHPLLRGLPAERFLCPLHFRIIKEGLRLPVKGFSEKDLVVAGEGADACYLYLAERLLSNGARHVLVAGLDVTSGLPEGNALLSGILESLGGKR